jgi:hypothetical protein
MHTHHDDTTAGPDDVRAASVTPTLDGVRIECAECPGDDAACGGCLVGFLTSREADDAVVFDVVEERALRTLRAGGLIGTVVERRPLRRGRIA